MKIRTKVYFKDLNENEQCGGFKNVSYMQRLSVPLHFII